MFEILRRINSTQQLSLVFWNSIKEELTNKEKSKQRRQTARWKEQQKLEKFKRKYQKFSKSPVAHQINTIIKEASHIKSKNINQYVLAKHFAHLIEEEKDISEEWQYEYESDLSDSTDIKTDDDDLNKEQSEYFSRCYALLGEDRYNHLRKYTEFIKHPLSLTCGINQNKRNCFMNFAIQLFARLHSDYIDLNQYKIFFNALKMFNHSIPLDPDLIKKEKMHFWLLIFSSTN